MSLRIATFNIRHGLGLDERLDLARSAAAIGALDCDLVAVQEVDVGCTRSANVDQAADLARLTGMRPSERIDYILAGPAGAWRVVAMEVIDDAFTSDHRPIRAALESTCVVAGPGRGLGPR